MNIVILIPSFKNDGPIKGAMAIAKLLAETFNIYLVSIRDNFNPSSDLDKVNVDIVFLKSKGIFNKFIEYQKFIKSLSNSDVTISFSLLFYPDLFNAFLCHKLEYKFSSVRSNMFKNYYFDYGLMGYLYAVIHYIFFRFIGNIIVMDQSMSDIVNRFTNNRISIIRNFVDEAYLMNYKVDNTSKRNNIIFIGSLSKRKSVDKLIYSFSEVVSKFPEFKLDIVGTGYELQNLKTLARQLNIYDKIVFHGHLNSPYQLLANSSIFVLPSKSEGTSRASLEALFFNVPVVLKNVDGNKFLINSNNGSLFESYSDLTFSITNIIKKDFVGKNLLPERYSSHFVKRQLVDLFNNL